MNTNDLFDELKKEKLEDIVPSFKQNSVTKEQISQVISNLSTKHQSLEQKYILAAVILLFLKGAASKATPGSLSIEVKGVRITKQDLENSVNTILNHKYIRRVAESMSEEIGTYAELNMLDGELAGRINKMITENNFHMNSDEPLLTPKERAWCSSFSQGIRNLDKLASPRLVKWLTIDYNDRFKKRQRGFELKKIR